MGLIEFKYVMIDGAFPIIFYASIEHKAFREIGNITSAAFIKITAADSGCGVIAETYGESDGLNMKPAPEDARIISMFLNKTQEVQP